MKIGRGLTNHLYCDVDGTLLLWRSSVGAPTRGEIENAHNAMFGQSFDAALMPALNTKLIEQIKAWHIASGGVLVIWTMAGKGHAEMARRLCKFGTERIICISKPDLAIDDQPNGNGVPTVVLPGTFKVPE